MKRLLFISSRSLYPIVDGDQIRTVQQCELLKEKFDVDVVYITSNDNDNSMEWVGEGKVYRFKVGKPQSLWQTLRFIINDLPLQVNYYYNRKVAKKIKYWTINYTASRVA